jgi:thiamine biosynthesis lipoprotein
MCNASKCLRSSIVLALLLAAAGHASVSGQPVARAEPYEYTAVHMGMPVRIRLYSGSEANAQAAARAAFARIATLDQMMSDYRPDSEVRRLPGNGNWTRVSVELFDVLERAVTLARLTDGAFDPTIGPLVVLWRTSRAEGRLPDPATIARERGRVGWRRIALDRSRRAVRLNGNGMRLDLGGIAKGYILQEALTVLRAYDTPAALIEAGGDIVAGDAPPDRRGWRVAVDGADPAFVARASELRNAALATSGPTEQFVEVDGRRYSHVVDPRTGVGLTNGVLAWVIAPDGATADALATALTVMDRERIPTVLASLPGVLVSISSADSRRPSF